MASYAATAGPLSEWLSRFSTLRRPLDGSAELPEVLVGAANIVSGLLIAKGAAFAAQTAAEAAQRAKESAEKVSVDLGHMCPHLQFVDLGPYGLLSFQ